MASRDIHKKPFTEETITKLEIFEAYVREWLPVFIQSPHFDEVNICDFFAGTGSDSNGVLGSPLRILEVIKEYKDSIIEKRLRICLLLNEYKKKKFNEMSQAVQNNLQALNLNGSISVEYCNEDFQQLFQNKANSIKDKPNLIFLDQSGVKHVPHNVFATLDSFRTTDFMFFIASSFFNRFGTTNAFQEYFPDLDQNEIKAVPFRDIHRVIVNYYRNKLPQFSKTRLYPFTIKKDQNIYGLIFGTKNVLGAEKFLKIAWDKNKTNGEANFDIDDDIDKQQAVLFPEMKRKTKIEIFQDDVFAYMVKAGSVTNKDLYDFALDNGFLPSHVVDYMRVLKHEKKIDYDGHCRISYDKCYKNPDKVIFKVLK